MLPAQVRQEGERSLYTEVGCNRRRRGEELVAIATASMELAKLAGEPLTVGKEVRRGELGMNSSGDSKLTRERETEPERQSQSERQSQRNRARARDRARARERDRARATRRKREHRED